MGFHSSSPAGSFQSVVASVTASADGGDVADHSWVGIGQCRGASFVRKAEMSVCPEQGSSFSAAELPAAKLSVGGHCGAEGGQSCLHGAHGAAADTRDASLLAALLAAAASGRDGYYAGEIPPVLEHAVAGPVNVDWPGLAAAQQPKAENCTELQFASKQGPQSCYQVGIIL